MPDPVAATVSGVLHVDRRVDALAAWSHAGWKPLLAESATTTMLYFALAELGPASDAEDIGAVQDLAAELGALLDLVVLQPVSDEPNLGEDGQLRSIALRLWGDLQYAIGRRHWVDIGLHAAVLRRLVGAELRPRPADAVPPYRPVDERVGPSHLPLIERPASERHATDNEDPGRRFLELLPAALIAGTGHLVDPETGQLPRDAIPARVGWLPAQGAPAQRRIGSLRDAGAAGTVMTLEPEAAVAAVNDLVEVPADPNAGAPLSRTGVADALARAWLLDTTLIIGTNGARRRLAVHTSVLDGGAESWLWQLPLSIWHPHQFYAGQRDHQPGGRALRVVRDRRW